MTLRPEGEGNVANCVVHAEAIAEVDRAARLTLAELLAAARDDFAAGRLEVAKANCLVGLSRFPDSAPLLSVLGWVYAQGHELRSAEATFQHALCHDPESFDSHAGLAAVLAAGEKFAAAEPHYRQALAVHAADADALYNFGCTLIALRRFDEAIAVLERAVKLEPMLDGALHNLAIAHAQLGHWNSAIEFCDRALARNAAAWQAKLLRGMARVALGSFGDGWDDYEARCQSQDGFHRQLGLPAWGGLRDEKQSIIILPEQGVGTQLLFASCLPDVAQHVSRVSMGCDPRLVGMLQRALPAVEVVAEGLLPMLAASGCFDCYLMAGSLPPMFRRTLRDFPGTPYLAPRPDLQPRWRQRLDTLGAGMKVGISWGGGAGTSDTQHRRTSPQDWWPLAAVPGIAWINLQHDAAANELRYWHQMAGERFHDWTDFDKKHDLENFTALVSQLDLVITVVNSTVHFAGAIGTPTWTLVPAGGEWRWQASGEKCVWHNSVRLFRQQRLDDWAGVFSALRDEISALVRFAIRPRRERAA